ncbi:hypothetical protein [Kordia sp.]|uniref:hypothetical protein n=1 Tax=Kordia sp. TaxID=1965332 RepID=UPI003D293E9C
MKKQYLKNLALNKKSISKLTALDSVVGGNPNDDYYQNTILICYKTKPFQGGNLCYKTMNECWHTEVQGCGVPNTYQVDPDTVALC